LNSFASLDLIEPLRRALRAQNYKTPTPIQAQAIPPLLAGHDLLGCAQTGTGKTAAFLLPVLQQLAATLDSGPPEIRALILTPTRELAAQIGESFKSYARYLDLYHLVLFGGVNQRPQVAELRRGIDLLVATPGRLLDLQQQGYVDLNKVEFLVLDEADRMLDMGFIRDIRKVLALLPKERQNLLFSATMPEPIVKLAGAFLNQPVRVDVDPQAITVERIDQRVMFVTRGNKKRLLRSILRSSEVESAIVFTRTKHGGNRVVKELAEAGLEAVAIHGNKSQRARTRALNGFKSGAVRVLVATDIASRGIDIEGVSHVFNYDLPNLPESYVHRIGRTGRAGRGGAAIAFCDESESEYLRQIEKLTGTPLAVVEGHEWHCAAAVPGDGSRRAQGQRPGAPSRGRRRTTRRAGSSPRARAGQGRRR
jgi:ATP-dependent RNA helicase RhlE